MPTPRKAKRAAEHAEPSVSEPSQASPPAEVEAEAAPEEDAAEIPMNRAARRAKGKTGQQSQAYGPGRVAGSKGPAHTQRMWSNRRSGG